MTIGKTMQGLREYYCRYCLQLRTQERSHPCGASCVWDRFANLRLTLADDHLGHTQPVFSWHKHPDWLFGFLGKASPCTKKIL